MTVVSISSHYIHSMTVFVPESSLVRQSTVGDSYIVVIVVGREWTAVVIRHWVTFKKALQNYYKVIYTTFQKFGLSTIFFKEINTFIQQKKINKSISNKYCSFEPPIY